MTWKRCPAAIGALNMKVKIVEAQEQIAPDVLQNAERALGKALPEEFKRFVLKHNGGRPEPATFRVRWSGQDWAIGWERNMVHFFLSFQGGSENFLDYSRTFQGRIPADTVPIAYDPGGNLILLGISGPTVGRVFFWMREYEVPEGETPDYSNVGLIANSFNEFLDSLAEE